ncbi:pectinesterase QRT1-like [Vicia villosa]|uniref:pectinesterase QRT1-like n=1 Tax=Vicia villosa TaxID=3911 RepID=UPI00273CBC04|nr:pectinesterase QRT1-like [Vicia villosa]
MDSGGKSAVSQNCFSFIGLLISSSSLSFKERVFVPITKPYVSFIGRRNLTAGPVITWKSKSSDRGPNGRHWEPTVQPFESGFLCATGVTFKNTAIASASGKGMQAVALRVDSDYAMFHRVNLRGTQDTTIDNTGTHYLYQCLFEGKVDFIFGSAISLSCFLLTAS